MNEQERNQLIGTLLNDGVSLSDIQKILNDEHNINLTYMDLRMITSDLETLDWERIEPKVEEEPEEEETSDVTAPPEGCIINVSKIVRPGYMMSGDVTFRSGIVADWFIDQSGRLGLDPKGEEKPEEEELMEFQQELQRIASQGAM